jgi:hypothetical protein
MWTRSLCGADPGKLPEETVEFTHSQAGDSD